MSVFVKYLDLCMPPVNLLFSIPQDQLIALKCRYLCLETIHIFVCQRVKQPVLNTVVWPGLWLIFLYDLKRLVLFVALPGTAPETRKENNKCIGQCLSGGDFLQITFEAVQFNP